MVVNSLEYYLSQIPEFRQKKGLRHELKHILILLIMAALSGRTGLRAVSRFAAHHEKVFVKMWQLKYGVPSFGTFRTVLQTIPFETLNDALFQWTNHFAPIETAGWLSGDGKALRSTVTDSQDATQRFLYLVSLCAQQTGLIYSSHKSEQGKDYEPDIIRAMLTELKDKHAIDLTELPLRLDALHCQKNMLSQELGNLMVGLKRNCPVLHIKAQECVAKAISEESTDLHIETDERGVTRTTITIPASSEMPKNWTGIKGIVCIKRRGIRIKRKANPNHKHTNPNVKVVDCPIRPKKKKQHIVPFLRPQQDIFSFIAEEETLIHPPMINYGIRKRKPLTREYFEETSYYALKKYGISAKEAAQAGRGQWVIENKVHRYKDVVFREDSNKIKDHDIAASLSQMFNFSLNILVLCGYKSVTSAVENLTNDISTLSNMIFNTNLYTIVEN